MDSNHAFMAKELPEEEMKMLYSLLGKKVPKPVETQPKFRLNFRFARRMFEDK
ncbi:MULTISPECIES: hypothetical protein [Antarcticibacterium]|uniref:hypothetical protein n=1 Tax=Antarcticibacterium TaxID=2058174 RepID=UPI00143CDA50|nr:MULTISPECIES: hypothetical protein [Antarcticibacterium]